MGGGRKHHQAVASCGGYNFICVFHAAVFACRLDASIGAVERRGNKREEGNRGFSGSQGSENVHVVHVA